MEEDQGIDRNVTAPGRFVPALRYSSLNDFWSSLRGWKSRQKNSSTNPKDTVVPGGGEVVRKRWPRKTPELTGQCNYDIQSLIAGNAW
jgi:hypothetical protein